MFAWPIAAQEQRGSIEGVVKDSSGAVLPGVTVEARSSAGAVLSSTTDTEGAYRFPSVAPGTYEITATLQGFTPKKQADVSVGLGQIKKVDLALGLAGVAESVQVVAESPLVDVKQSARQTNISREQIDLLPKGRDFTTLVTQAPGANTEAKLGGLSIDGASAGENRYIIDGIETTDIQQGISGKNVIADFVEEIQVKSSGYSAEFGGATGGVINVITKSGTNALHGNALFNFQGDQLSGGAVPAEGFTDVFGTGIPSLRINPLNSDLAEYITYPEDKVSRVEPGFALGGPIVTNRAWFFGAYQPTFTSIERTVNATTSSNPAGQPNSATRKRQEQYITANLTGQMSDSLRGRVAFNNSWRQLKGLLPTPDATDPAGSDYGKTSNIPELLGVGQHGLGRFAEPVLRHPGRLLHVRLARRERDGGSTLQLDDHEQHRFPGRAGQPAAPDRVLERALEQQSRQRSADPCELPGGRHRVREAGRRPPVEVRRVVRHASATTWTAVKPPLA